MMIIIIIMTTTTTMMTIWPSCPGQQRMSLTSYPGHRVWRHTLVHTYIGHILLAPNICFSVKHGLPFVLKGIAMWNDKLYLLFPGLLSQSPDIRVYNADSFKYQRTITVGGMKDPYDIVASDNVLYVSEFQDKLIHRIELPEESVSNWTVDGVWLKLSIAKNGNVIVACWNPHKIFEYTSFGNLVREIVVNRFDTNLVELQHAIQMEGDKFLVCHAETTHHRVCMIDNTGRVIKCYGGNKGSGIGHVNMPTYLAVDRNGFILVADCDNNRIVRLKSSLEYISETVGIQKLTVYFWTRSADVCMSENTITRVSRFSTFNSVDWDSLLAEFSSIVWCSRSYHSCSFRDMQLYYSIFEYIWKINRCKHVSSIEHNFIRNKENCIKINFWWRYWNQRSSNYWWWNLRINDKWLVSLNRPMQSQLFWTQHMPHTNTLTMHLCIGT